jgi:hypothetical protein
MATVKIQAPSSNSIDKMRELVMEDLKSVGVRQNARKPGDGRFSALLRKPDTHK